MTRLRRLSYVVATIAARIGDRLMAPPPSAWAFRADWPVDSPASVAEGRARRGSPRRL